MVARKKENKKVEEEEESDKELDVEIGNVEEDVEKLRSILYGDHEIVLEKVELNGVKPISDIKKGDKMLVDGVQLEVDAHYILIDHGKTKEMAIELFNPKTDKDYQLRYFSDNVQDSIEFYELQEIIFVKKPVKKIEW